MTGVLFKGMGMLPGLSDLVLVATNEGRVAVGFCELKRPDGKGSLSPDQQAFRDLVQGLGLPWRETTTLDGVSAWATEVLGLVGLKFKAAVQ